MGDVRPEMRGSKRQPPYGVITRGTSTNVVPWARSPAAIGEPQPRTSRRLAAMASSPDPRPDTLPNTARPGAARPDTGRWMLPFLAGAAGLGAEVVYLKALDFAVGSAPVVRLTVVSTFIVGMGCGSLLSSRIRRPWRIEFVMAGWSLLWLFGHGVIADLNATLIRSIAPTAGIQLTCALVGFIHLVVPSLALGVALPAITEHETNVGRVYAHHAVGALAGIAIFEAIVYPTFGLAGGWLLLSALHLCVAWYWMQRTGQTALQPQALGRFEPRLFSVGVATGGYQGVWFLIAALIFRPFYYIAPTVVAAFLLGQAVGAAVWNRRPTEISVVLRWTVVGMCLSTIAVGAWVSLPQARSASSAAAQTFLLLLPAAIPIGAIYPAWLKDATTSRDRTGGALLSLSVGNAVGLFLGGGLLLSMLPPLWVATLLAVTIAAVGLHTARTNQVAGRGRAELAFVCLAAVGAAVMPDGRFIRGAWTEHRDIEVERYFRGPGELTAVYSHAEGHRRVRRVYQSGYSPVNLEEEGGLLGEATVGAVAVAHAPRRNRALVLGAGSGRTAGFVTAAFEHTVVIDIGHTVPALLDYLTNENYAILNRNGLEYLPIDAVLAPYLLEKQSLDLIVHTLHPGYVDRAAKLYTEEFLAQVATLLKDDGVFVSWADSTLSREAHEIYVATIASAFPEIRLYPVRRARWDFTYFLVVASKRPVGRNTDIAWGELADELAVRQLAGLEEHELPSPVRTLRTHRYDRPATELLAAGFQYYDARTCQGPCSPGDTIVETSPCPGGGTRQKRQACGRDCEWGPWTEWTECTP